MNVGFYPIKEAEMKQIIRMNLSYFKKDTQSIDTILEQNRVDSKTKEFVYECLRECINNRKAPYFNTSFGMCIAKMQKIYRNNYIFNDKSFTKLMNLYPVLKSYNTSLGEVIKFKDNKYMFKDQLETNNSSGVYIKYENVKRLYNDYYLNINVKKYIDSYYGSNGYGNNRFIQVLDYCIQNQCGLLEADISIGYSDVQPDSQSMPTTNHANSNNESTINTEAKSNTRIVSVKKRTWEIIGFRLLMGLTALGANSLHSYVLSIILSQFLKTNNTVEIFESMGYSTVDSIEMLLSTIMMIVYILEIICFIATNFIFRYFLFYKIVSYTSHHEKIDDSQRSKFVKYMAIFFAILACISIGISVYHYASQISSINNNINFIEKKPYYYDSTDSVIGYFIATEVIAGICMIIEIITTLFINIKTFLNVKNNITKAES